MVHAAWYDALSPPSRLTSAETTSPPQATTQGIQPDRQSLKPLRWVSRSDCAGRSAHPSVPPPGSIIRSAPTPLPEPRPKWGVRVTGEARSPPRSFAETPSAECESDRHGGRLMDTVATPSRAVHAAAMPSAARRIGPSGACPGKRPGSCIGSTNTHPPARTFANT